LVFPFFSLVQSQGAHQVAKADLARIHFFLGYFSFSGGVMAPLQSSFRVAKMPE